MFIIRTDIRKFKRGNTLQPRTLATTQQLGLVLTICRLFLVLSMV